jgi:hypothetical protein
MSSLKRIFSVRTNVDTLAASVGLLLTDNEKALWLQGYISALQGGELRQGLPAPMLAGWTVGNESWNEARDHQLKSSAGGKKSIAEHPENRVDKRPPSDPPRYVPPKPPSDSPLEQSLIVNPVIFNQESRDPAIDPAEQEIFNSPPLKPISKPKLGLLELNSIPGLKVIPKDQQKLLAVLNEVGLDVMTQATRKALKEIGNGYESSITPIAYAIHAETLKPPKVEIAPLPDRLTDLPITNPMNPNYWKNKGSQQ